MGDKCLVVANWKCNGGSELLRGYLNAFLKTMERMLSFVRRSFFLTQPALIRKNVSLGSQDLSALQVGPYTGDISSEMILEWNLDAYRPFRASGFASSEVEVFKSFGRLTRWDSKRYFAWGDSRR